MSRNQMIGLLVAACAVTVHPQAQEGTVVAPLAAAPFELVMATTGLPQDGRWKSVPVLADLNQDGFLDLISHPRLGRKPGVWLGDGKGTWTDSSEGLSIPKNTTCGGGVEVADINKDGHPDLAVADHCDGVYVFFGDGKGHWTVGTKELNPALAKNGDQGENPWVGMEDLAVGDVNEDGKLDIVAAGSDRGGFAIFIGDGSGTTWQEQPYSGLPTTEVPGEGEADGGGWAREVVLQDINNDKHLDLIASYHRGPRVWLGDGKGKFTAASNGLPSPMMFGIFQQLVMADVNRDGRLDLVVANTINGPEVYLQNADGSWKTTPDVMPPMRGGAMSVAAGDLDGDGFLDLVVGGRLSKIGQYGIFALRNDGKGGWSQWKTAMADDRQQVVWGVTLADVNGDKRPDIVAALGGAMGAVGQNPGKSAAPTEEGKGRFPHLQVWLNQPAAAGR